jgi:hypothetical protein
MAYLLNAEDHPAHPLEMCVENPSGNGSRMLGFLSGHEGFSEGWGVSGDGSKVVGRAHRFYNPDYYPNPNNLLQCGWGDTNYVAFIWDATNGMQDLKEVLLSLLPEGAEKTDLNDNWTLTNATAISNDGTVICGMGYNDAAEQWQGWVATIGREGPKSACCSADLICSNETLPDCKDGGGTYRAGKNCDTYVCCHTPFADTDGDGDVDQMDFAAFQLCYTGAGGGVPEGCECWDRDGGTGDNDVDANDFTAFSNCWTGPNVPYSAALRPLCVTD